MRQPLACFAAALLATQLAACGGGTAAGNSSTRSKTPADQLRPKSFRADCSDFLSYTADALTEQYLSGGFAPGPTPIASPAAPTAGGDANGGPERGSGTTVQEAGVDEADIVKSDASGRFYVLRASDLLVMKAHPASGLSSTGMQRVALSEDSASFYGQEFFLDEAGKRLVVFGTRYGGGKTEAETIVYSLANPDAPAELLRMAVDGHGLTARRIGSRVHRVSRFDLPYPSWFFNDEALNKQREDHRAALNRKDEAGASRIKSAMRGDIGNRVQQQGAASFLPGIGQRTAAGPTGSTLACNSIQRPDVTTATGLVLVESFNTDGSARAVSALVNNSYIVYASAQNLYLTQTSGGWFFAPSQLEESVVYRLALSATGAAGYQGLAKVDGHIPGRFALSEHQGHLRVASNEMRPNSRGDGVTRYTHLTVFKADAPGDMAQTGAVRDLAPGEALRGSRFVGPRGYLVTFRNVDPLFAFDLSNPASPQLRSALKIPGFSSYLEPVGSDHLLTVGRAGDEENLNGQLAVQLFDVRDLANVKLVSSISPAVGGSGYSYSPAEYEPRAFTYFSDRADAAAPGTLSVPLQSYNGGDSSGFSGFMVVRVNPAASPALAELGRIDHKEFSDTRNYCSGGGGGNAAPPHCFSSVYAADPLRSVFLQDASGTALFTISSLGIKASDAAAPSRELARRKFD